ncbi:hypothetical protein ACFY36_14520 [Actinoplanes sp. NPDC000266]
MTILWFVNTAGVSPDDGYQWRSLDGKTDPSEAKAVEYGSVAGRELLRLVTASRPCLVLGRLQDRSFVLYVSGLLPTGAPTQGDSQNRPITATLLGIASKATAPRPLVNAAAAALTGRLAEFLPLSWTANGHPEIDMTRDQWLPPAPVSSAVPNVQLSHGALVSPADAGRVADELLSLRADQMADFPIDRPLVLMTNALVPAELEKLRPWRAISPQVARRIAFPDEDGFWTRRRVLIAVLAGAVVVGGILILILILRQLNQTPGR